MTVVFHGKEETTRARPQQVGKLVFPGLEAEPVFGTIGRLKLSVKSDYAARAVLFLARRYGRRDPVPTDEIARENSIPPNYLVQILIELKSARIVRSQRGKEGGYLLARSPAEITLGDVLRAVQVEVLDPAAARDMSCPPELREAWTRVATAFEAEVNRISFAQLVETGEARGRMFYI